MPASGPIEQLNQELLETQIRLQTILRVSPVGIAVTRLSDEVIVEFNDALLDVVGYDRDELLGRTSLDMNIWVDPAERAGAFAKILAGSPISDMPIVIRRKDGEIRHALFSATVINLGDERCFVGSLRDVSDKLAIEQEKEALAQRLRVSLSMMPITVFHQDRDLRYTFIANPQIGQSVDAIVGHFDHELFDPEDAAILTAIKQRVLDTGVGERHEVPIQRDGRIYWFDTLVEPERGPDDQVLGLICGGADITELKQREERYRAVLEDQTELICRYRPDGCIIYANEVYCRFFGKTEVQLIGHHWRPVAHSDDLLRIEAALANLSPKNPVICIENRVFAADGSEHWMQFVNRGMFDRSGFLREIQSVGRDISERKQAEKELDLSRQELHALFEESDRLREEQRKEIAREIHDQLGAVLTAIGLRIDVIAQMVEKNVAVAREIRQVNGLVSEAKSAAREICNSLRPPVLDDLGLVEACRWYVKDWSKLLGIDTQGRFSQLPEVLPERLSTDLFRVLQELLTNVARHAGARSVRVSLLGDKKQIRLRVADDGNGFVSEGKVRAYGLAGVRERMARYGGQVSIQTGERGTTVSIGIPLGLAE